MDGSWDHPKLTLTKSTHYGVLGLTPDILSSQLDASPIIKRAYRRALLQNHPDKKRGNSKPTFYSVDQISQAFAVLNSPRQRAEYDQALLLSRSSTALSSVADPHDFQTGIDSVDLDDLEFDEPGECWFRSCRCGNDRGFLVRAEELEEVEADRELLVGCRDCSLWLKVLFDVVTEDSANSDSPTLIDRNATNS